MTDLIYPEWPAPPHIKAFTTTRQFYVDLLDTTEEKPRFDLGMREGVNPAQSLKNRALVEKKLQLPNPPKWLHQIHGTEVVQAESSETNPIADAAFSRQPNTPCVVLTADCLPVLICNPSGTEVAAIHAGWRGLAAGIIPATLKKLSTPAEKCLIWFGPAIGPTQFEVGNDVIEAFTSQNSAFQAGFRRISNDKAMADIFELARIQLSEFGITTTYGGQYCTVSDPVKFYSYRREQGLYGTLATFIWIED